jgi:hypothetical protein
MNELSAVAMQIVTLHIGISKAMRRSVDDAVRIGQLLTEQKDKMEHGKFLPWLKLLPFAERTARRYMQLFEYRDKTATVADLNEAYALIEDLRGRQNQQQIEHKPHPVESSKPTEPGKRESLDPLSARPAPIVQAPEDAEPEEVEARSEEDAVEIPAAPEEELKAMTIARAVREAKGYIDVRLEMLSDDIARHEYINEVIKYLRAQSIEFNKTA